MKLDPYSTHFNPLLLVENSNHSFQGKIIPPIWLKMTTLMTYQDHCVNVVLQIWEVCLYWKHLLNIAHPSLASMHLHLDFQMESHQKHPASRTESPIIRPGALKNYLVKWPAISDKSPMTSDQWSITYDQWLVTNGLWPMTNGLWPIAYDQWPIASRII